MIQLGNHYSEEYIDLNVRVNHILEFGNRKVPGQWFRVYVMASDWYYTFMYDGEWKCVYLTM